MNGVEGLGFPRGGPRPGARGRELATIKGNRSQAIHLSSLQQLSNLRPISYTEWCNSQISRLYLLWKRQHEVEPVCVEESLHGHGLRPWTETAGECALIYNVHFGFLGLPLTVGTYPFNNNNKKQHDLEQSTNKLP